MFYIQSIQIDIEEEEATAKSVAANDINAHKM